jgi:hypothetical protein
LQGSIQDWLQLDEGDPERARNCCSDKFFNLFLSALPILIKFPFVFFWGGALLGLSFASLIRISEDLLYS